MKIEALNHLADVGFATNLAVGLTESYRGVIRAKVTDHVAAVSTALKAEILDKIKVSDDIAKDETDKIEKIRKRLDSATAWWQRVTTFLAVSASIVLVLFLLCAAVHGDVECKIVDPWVWAGVIGALGSTPIILSWLMLFGHHRFARWQLKGLAKRYDIVAYFTNSKTISINPTPPGPTPSGPPGPTA